ncbi:hemolysin family protein [Myxococcota bacterium]|nr:hemolysin family protein [Myxococcota bacterium]
MSSYFSGTETAITALSHMKISILKENHPFISPVLLKWEENPGIILSILLIGNNIVNIFGTLLAGRIAFIVFSDFSRGMVDLIAGITMTFFVLIFGEVTPKTFAKINPEKWIIPALFFFRLIDWIIMPFAIVLSKMAQFFVKIMGGNNKPSEITQSEIEYIIEKSSTDGVFDQDDQGELLSSVIEFKYTIVREIMTPRTDTKFLSSNTTLQDALDHVQEWGHSRVPVFKDNLDNIVGILYVKDLINFIIFEKHDLNEKVLSVARKIILYVPETQKINQTLKKFQQTRNHLAIVVDEFGGTSGIITLEDIIEEIVGDIQDETDQNYADLFVRIDENTVIADAHISIDELETYLKITLPESSDYSSLGGFIINEIGIVPPVGYFLLHNGFSYIISESNEKQISKVQIKFPAVHKSEDECDQ